MTQSIVEKFYTAFTQHDGEVMADCYHEDIVFEDPAFGKITGRDPGDMWRMLNSSSSSSEVTFKILEQSDTAATVNWKADYTFPATGRQVHNDVTAKLTIRDGKIVTHHDSFDFWKWSGQALGAPGKLLGWTPFLKAKVIKTARGRLADYQAGKGS